MCIICKRTVSYIEGNLSKRYPVVCSHCPDVIRIPRIQGIEILEIINCKNLEEIPHISSLKELNVINCPKIRKIPFIEGLKVLNFYGCPVENIPKIPTLEYLNCGASFVTEIPIFPKLRNINCSKSNVKIIPNLPVRQITCNDCPFLTEIAVTNNRKEMWASNCPLLHKIAETYSYLLRYRSPFIVKENMEKLIKLQKFAKKYVKYIRIKRYIKSREFVEWFYAPENFGGYKSKQRILKSLLK